MRVVLPCWLLACCCCCICDVFPNYRRVRSFACPVLVCMMLIVLYWLLVLCSSCCAVLLLFYCSCCAVLVIVLCSSSCVLIALCYSVRDALCCSHSVVASMPLRLILRQGSCLCCAQIIHGDRDEVVPFSHGVQLHRQLVSRHDHHPPPLWVRGAGHNDVEAVAGDRFPQAIGAFITSLQP